MTSQEGTQGGYLTPSYTSLAGQRSQAVTWRAVGFVALGAALASVPAVILTW